MKGRLIVISGPSGTGKGSICRELVEKTGIEVSVSATTRSPRKGERDGVDYFFLTEEEFVDRINRGEFIEHAQTFNRRYGTPKSYVLEKNSEGKDVILEIDVKGGASVRRSCPDAVLIMVVPPDLIELRNRLCFRGSEERAQIEERLALAVTEISKMKDYDFVVVNDELDRAVEEIISIIEAVHSGSSKADIYRVTEAKAEAMIKKFREEEKNVIS